MFLLFKAFSLSFLTNHELHVILTMYIRRVYTYIIRTIEKILFKFRSRLKIIVMKFALYYIVNNDGVIIGIII